MATLTGCPRQSDQKPYLVLTGVVKAINVNTGELLVHSERPSTGWETARDVLCLVTKDSEVYINSRFAPVNEAAARDAVEVVGYREGDRFVVSTVNVTRPEPEPPPPKLSAAAAPPAP